MADYHVATTGSDSGAGTLADPWLTIAYALEHGGGASNRIYIHAGTYAENIASDVAPVVGGGTWATRLLVSRWGSDVVIVQPASGARVLFLGSAIASYIEFVGIIFDGTSVSGDVVKLEYNTGAGTSHDVRFTSCTVRNGPVQGVLVVTAYRVSFVGCTVHDNGTLDTEHGIYISSHDNLVDTCDVYNNAGWGVHIYNGGTIIASNNVVRKCLCHNNAGAGVRGAGILIGSGFSNVAEDNVCWGNDVGLQIAYNAINSVARRNIIFDNTNAEIEVGPTATGTIQDGNRLPVTV